MVVSLGRAWSGAQELSVDVEGVGPVRSLAYPDLVGDVRPGDHVVLNTTALDRGLGTGGYAMVITVLPALGNDPSRPRTAGSPGPGHLVKARYTPLQTMVLGIDEQESPHHDLLRRADDLAGMPVVVADLHSAVPAIVAGARLGAAQRGDPQPRIVYVMTDGGALPAGFSRTIAGLRDAGWLASCITVGQSFGGDHEAVTVHTGLLAAHVVLDADLVVVAQGPGNLGTGTRWGFSGVSAGETVNAVSTLAGNPVASLRISGADPRDRHLGVSHHSLTAYGRVALRPADVVVPVLTGAPSAFAASGQDPAALDARIGEQVAALSGAGHHLVTVDTSPELLAALEESPVGLSTMGRGLEQDPAAFLGAAVAGLHAARTVRR
ncbi:Protein of unknown function [Sanguibacter gelidistatuariae]|uniref:DUF3866 domain-containing protein n=1 Tax=Sanguibacter gelidistatuariae TaxID=1814289 RepID=A0A1G6JD85_9MICO|nr:Protein of unknown function [Sanguibacter gelidistatuariae]